MVLPPARAQGNALLTHTPVLKAIGEESDSQGWRPSCVTLHELVNLSGPPFLPV